MLVKEKGYDEFLAEQIEQGRADRLAGRVMSQAQSKQRTQALIHQARRDYKSATQSKWQGH